MLVNGYGKSLTIFVLADIHAHWKMNKIVKTSY